jgi:hypothetical protein
MRECEDLIWLWGDAFIYIDGFSTWKIYEVWMRGEAA